ncbi:unnamed protein product [Lathyrus sativus]|nr:unnamed protein product [Lathyrus sativus]
MIICWNVIGINNAGKSREVFARINNLNPALSILVGTRVKHHKAQSIRNKLGTKRKYLDNYEKHYNGKIWVLQDETRLKVKKLNSSHHFIHLEMENIHDGKKKWCTTIYGLNTLDMRKRLLRRDIENLPSNSYWFIIGDFNNVCSALDRISGKDVVEGEYTDLTNMMENMGLYEKDSVGDHFTWFNNHDHEAIYSIIDRVIGNMIWIQNNMNTPFRITEAGVANHALLCLEGLSVNQPKKPMFKFQNVVINLEGFHEAVRLNWNHQVEGTAMFIMWKKLLNLKNTIRDLSKPLNGVKEQLESARNRLKEAQILLERDMLNSRLIEETKTLTEDVIILNNIEEPLIYQREKIN